MKTTHKANFLAAALVGALAFTNLITRAQDPLPSWNDGTAQRLPDTKVGAFPQALYDKAQTNGWTVISMKNDWKQIFAFEK
jgi:hypothetical protein